MNCRKCNAELVPDAVYCHLCGTKQVADKANPRRRGNGQGSAYKRGKTWTAATTKYRNGKRIVTTKGGFTTKKAALVWLAQDEKPTASTITVKQLYEEWGPTHFGSVSEKRKQILDAAFAHCKPLHDERWCDVGIKEMQSIVDTASDKYYTKKSIKALFAGMGEYAVITGYAEKEYAQYIKLPPEPVPEKTPFTEKEVELLWKDYEAGHDFTGSILIMLYTGMRCGELMGMKPENVHLEEGYMMGGIKTAAGKAGEILIIDKIKPLVKKLIVDGGLPKTSDTAYRKKFDNALKRAGCDPHTPHECRHTTATLLAKAGIQPAIIQSIMRHTKYSQSAEYTHVDRQTKINALSDMLQ